MEKTETTTVLFLNEQELKFRDGDISGVTALVNNPFDLPWSLNSSDYDAMLLEVLNEFHSGLRESDHLLATIYIVLIVFSAIANVFVIVIIVKNRKPYSATRYFAMNLSVADLLVTAACMPLALFRSISTVWTQGEMTCKLVAYLQGVAVTISIFTITVMSIDRYLAIKSNIMRRKTFNRKTTVMIILAIWLISMCIFIPALKAVKLRAPDQNLTVTIPWAGENKTISISEEIPGPICSQDFITIGIDPRIFGIISFVLVYMTPGCVITITYILIGCILYTRKPPVDSDSIKGSTSYKQGHRLVQERKRVAWTLLVLAIIFAVCWCPYNVLQLLFDFDVMGPNLTILKMQSYALFLGHLNSAINPVMYTIMTRQFRICCNGGRSKPTHKQARQTLPNRFTAKTAISMEVKPISRSRNRRSTSIKDHQEQQRMQIDFKSAQMLSANVLMEKNDINNGKILTFRNRSMVNESSTQLHRSSEQPLLHSNSETKISQYCSEQLSMRPHSR